MKKRIKYLIIFIIAIITIVGLTDIFLKAKNKKEKELALEKDKIDKQETYSIKRENNKYSVKSTKLEDKSLQKVFYDDTNVYLYYDGETTATLLKYNVESSKVIVLYENSDVIHGDMQKIGKYYKLGNTVFDSKLKKVMDYKEPDPGEILFPNLKYSLVKTETGVGIKNILTNEIKNIIDNSETETYSPYSIKNDEKYILLNKTVDNNNYIVVLNNKYEIINTFNNTNEDVIKSYSLLDDVPYLLEKDTKEDEITYKVYDVKTKELTYKNDKYYKNYYFDDTKFICLTKEGDIKLIDYVTKEEKNLLKKEKKELIPKDFILSSDRFSLVLTLENKNNEFYIFYL